VKIIITLSLIFLLPYFSQNEAEGSELMFDWISIGEDNSGANNQITQSIGDVLCHIFLIYKSLVPHEIVLTNFG